MRKTLISLAVQELLHRTIQKQWVIKRAANVGKSECLPLLLNGGRFGRVSQAVTVGGFGDFRHPRGFA